MNTYDWYILYRIYLNIYSEHYVPLLPSFKIDSYLQSIYKKTFAYCTYASRVQFLWEKFLYVENQKYNGILKKKRDRSYFLSRDVSTINAISRGNNSRKINNIVSLISDVQNLFCLIVIRERISFCIVSLSSSQRVNRKKREEKKTKDLRRTVITVHCITVVQSFGEKGEGGVIFFVRNELGTWRTFISREYALHHGGKLGRHSVCTYTICMYSTERRPEITLSELVARFVLTLINSATTWFQYYLVTYYRTYVTEVRFSN